MASTARRQWRIRQGRRRQKNNKKIKNNNRRVDYEIKKEAKVVGEL